MRLLLMAFGLWAAWRIAEENGLVRREIALAPPALPRPRAARTRRS